MSPDIVNALVNVFPTILPEAVLGLMACVLFLGGTFRANRHLWGTLALAALAAAGFALWQTALPPYGTSGEAARASLFAGPLVYDRLAVLIKAVALVGGAVLVLFSWDEVPHSQAADYHACLLLITAGLCLTGAANELITLFLALELISIPTYVLLYLPRTDRDAQEAAMKYFLLSVFSSALLLFGFSYLYGLGGTTNLPALADTLAGDGEGAMPGVALVALVMVVAGLGFKITMVPFHFYAPDVYQGAPTAGAALLAFVPKVAGFVALMRVLGFVPHEALAGQTSALLTTPLLGTQVPTLLWILAAVTMTLGNVLALLQDNVKRLLAYSSVAHAGYMLIGLAVAPYLIGQPLIGGVEAVLFYLMAYGAMTVGAFAVVAHVSTPERPVVTVDDLAGLGRSQPGVALLMALFLFSLIGIPVTAGFLGKLFIFLGALGVPVTDASDPALREQARLFRILALIGAVNAAIAGWYYLRIAAVMYLRNPLQPVEKPRSWPSLAAIGVCAALTLLLGIYPRPVLREVEQAVPQPGRQLAAR